MQPFTLVKFHVHRKIIFSYGDQTKFYIKQNQARVKLVDKVMMSLLFLLFLYSFLDISRHESKEVNALMKSVLMIMVTTSVVKLFLDFFVHYKIHI